MLFPGLTYEDARAAIDFLERAFGGRTLQVVDGDGDRDVAHAEVEIAGGIVMLGSTRDDDFARPAGAGSVYVAVDDVDALHERAKAAGARIVRAPFDTDYGSRDFAAADPEGNLWFFGTYRPETGA